MADATPAQIPLYTRTLLVSTANKPFPPLLQTPAGLALVELQGTINLPTLNEDAPATTIEIGRIDFPDYRPDSLTFDPSSTAWMRRVYLFVGAHQRLTGEVKKLPRALAVVRRRDSGNSVEEAQEALEVVEIVKHKVVFSLRPEPVGTAPG